MTIKEQIRFLWTKKYQDALGTGHADPFEYADKHPDVAALRATLRRVERAQERAASPYRTRSRNF